MVKRLSKAIQPPRGPSYCHHRASGQAYVKVRGKVTYLGVYGTEASRDAYASAVAAILGGQEVPSLSKGKPNELPRLTVREVGDRFSFYAATYYVKNGKSTAEAGMVATACNHASAMFGDQPAEAFGPLALKSVRNHLVEMDSPDQRSMVRSDEFNKDSLQIDPEEGAIDAIPKALGFAIEKAAENLSVAKPIFLPQKRQWWQTQVLR